MFYYSVVNLLRIVIHYSKDIHYIFSSESLCVANSLQILNSLRFAVWEISENGLSGREIARLQRLAAVVAASFLRF